MHNSGNRTAVRSWTVTTVAAPPPGGTTKLGPWTTSTVPANWRALTWSERAQAARRNLPSRVAQPSEVAEVRVPVPDRDGVIAEVATLASEAGINIGDIHLARRTGPARPGQTASEAVATRSFRG